MAWTAPLECPTEREAVEEIERLLGRPLDARAGVSVEGEIRREDERFILVLVLEQGDVESRRELSDPSCESLTRAGALVIALAIDPTLLASLDVEGERTEPPGDAVADGEEQAEVVNEDTSDTEGSSTVDGPRSARVLEVPRPLVAPESSAEAGAAQADTESRPASPPPTPRFVGQAFGALSAGPLPQAAPGGGLALGVGYDALELVLEAYGIAPQEGQLADATAGGTVGLAGGLLRACASFDAVDGLLEVLPCGAFEAGAMWATGVRVPVIRTGFAPWLALSAGARLRVWFFDAVGLEAFAELQVPLLRAPFVLTLGGERREFHRSTEVGGRFGLGVSFRVQ
ncbi:MAG: hypothetical protein AB8I08_15370 [Sandaracinaceae bacterium]